MPRFPTNEYSTIRAGHTNDYRFVIVVMRSLVRMEIGQIGSVSFPCVNNQQSRFARHFEYLLARAHGFLQLGYVVPEFGPKTTRFEKVSLWKECKSWREMVYGVLQFMDDVSVTVDSTIDSSDDDVSDGTDKKQQS